MSTCKRANSPRVARVREREAGRAEVPAERLYVDGGVDSGAASTVSVGWAPCHCEDLTRIDFVLRRQDRTLC